MATDKNGLTLSNASDSGYKFVTTLFEGPLAGKFVAFADVKTAELQRLNKSHAHGINGFFGFKNVVPLGVFDDVRDAAYVGQTFHAGNADDRDDNLAELYAGNESVIPKSLTDWDNPADVTSMKKAATRAKTRRMGKTFDAKKAETAIDKFANNFKSYKIGNMDVRVILERMKELFDNGTSLTLSAETVCSDYQR